MKEENSSLTADTRVLGHLYNKNKKMQSFLFYVVNIPLAKRSMKDQYFVRFANVKCIKYPKTAIRKS
jgi:hypothetical protein